MRAGGAIGEVLAGLLMTNFNRTGAYIVVATGLFVSLILATQFSFAAFLQGGVGRVGARLRSAADGLGPLPRDPAQGEDAARGDPQARQLARGGGWAAQDPAREVGERGRARSRDRGRARGRSAAPGERAAGTACAEAAPLPRRFAAREPSRPKPNRRRPRSEGGAGVRKTALRWRARRAAATRCPRSPSSTRSRWRTARQRPPARARQDPAGEVGRVRRDGHGRGDQPRAGRHHLRVQARRRRQVLEDRGPGRRPGAGAPGRVDPHRPHERQGQRRDRDPERGARDDLAARDARVRDVPSRLGPPHDGARQDRQRRRLRRPTSPHAAPADRRRDRHRARASVSTA